MGDLFEVVCRDCDATGHTVTQAVMRGPIVRCDTCGETEVLPVIEHVSRMDESVELDLRWERAERAAWAAMEPCPCGGTFTADAPIRCSACRSPAVDTNWIGLAD